MGVLQNLNFLSQSVNNGQRPGEQEGPRAVPLVLDFTIATGNTSVLLDMKNAQAQARMSYVQTIFVDNSLSTVPTTINVNGLSQAIIIPDSSQAYVPLLAINPPVLVCANNGNVKVPIQLLNFPLPPCVWRISQGTVTVDQPALDALIGNWNGGGNALAVNDLALYALATTGAGLKVQGGGGGVPAANLSYSNYVGLGNTNAIAGTPAKQIIVKNLFVYLEPGTFSAAAAGDMITVDLKDNGPAGPIAAHVSINVPGGGAAPATYPPGHSSVELTDIDYAITAGDPLWIITGALKGSGITFTGPNPGLNVTIGYLIQ